MAIDLPNADERLGDDAWREIDRCLAEMSALAGQSLAEHEFYQAAVDRGRWALSAAAAGAWIRNGAGEWVVVAQAGKAAEAGRAKYVAQAAARREGGIRQPGRAAGQMALMTPVVVDGCALAVLEVQPNADTPASALAGQERFLAALAEIAAEYHRNALLRQLRGREGWWRGFAEFAARITDARNARRCAMEMANGARQLLEVDRAAIVGRANGKARMLAVSGVDQFDDRSEVVLAAEALAGAVLQINEALWHPVEGQVLAPQVEEALLRQLDASPAKALAVIPLAAEGREPCGVLLLERFTALSTGADWHDGWSYVARQCAGELESALAWEALPLGAWSRRVAEARRQGVSGRAKKMSLAVLVGLAALVAMAFIPARFEVNAPGVLQPVGLRQVYGGLEGEVVEVLVRPGDNVAEGQVLARLSSPKLEFESSRVLGELQTAQARLATLESARLESRFSNSEDAAKAQQLTAEEEELRATVKSLLAQQAVLQEERQLLEVRSPIAGRLVTPRDDIDALAARPVRTGQQLLTVADIAGPWELKLQVPDRLIGHVQERHAASADDQAVEFVLATDPRVQRLATVEEIALRAETDADGAATVVVTARVEASQLVDPRPGATVRARIECGRRGLGYVWFHQLVDRAAAWWALHT